METRSQLFQSCIGSGAQPHKPCIPFSPSVNRYSCIPGKLALILRRRAVDSLGRRRAAGLTRRARAFCHGRSDRALRVLAGHGFSGQENAFRVYTTCRWVEERTCTSATRRRCVTCMRWLYGAGWEGVQCCGGGGDGRCFGEDTLDAWLV